MVLKIVFNFLFRKTEESRFVRGWKYWKTVEIIYLITLCCSCTRDASVVDIHCSDGKTLSVPSNPQQEAPSLSILTSALTTFPLFLWTKWQFNAISGLKAASQSWMSGCLVASGRCLPSAAGKEFHSSIRHYSTVAVQLVNYIQRLVPCWDKYNIMF